MNIATSNKAKNLATSIVNIWHLQFRRAFDGDISRQEATSLAGLFMTKTLSDAELVESCGGIETVIGTYIDLYESHLFTCVICAPKESN